MAPNNVWQSVWICYSCRHLMIYNMTLCTQTCRCCYCNHLVNNCMCNKCSKSTLHSGGCVYELKWLHFIQAAESNREWPSSCFTSLSWLLCLICIWPYWFDQYLAGFMIPLDFVILSHVYYLLKSPCAFFVHSATTLILQLSCSCRARQVAWSQRGWILIYLRGCFVLILFKEPTFLVGTGSISLLFCVIWFRGCICSCLPSGTVRGSLACQITGCAERHSSVRKG